MKQNYKVFVDLIEVNVSQDLRKAISAATGAPIDTHMLLSRECIPLLQGISHSQERFKECATLMHQVQTNGLVVICPKEV